MVCHLRPSPAHTSIPAEHPAFTIGNSGRKLGLATLREDETQEDLAVCRILEGMRADAFQIARDLGAEHLSKCDGIDQLIEAIQREDLAAKRGSLRALSSWTTTGWSPLKEK